MIPAREKYTGHLVRYYDEIISFLRHAGTVLIFGPGRGQRRTEKAIRAGECPQPDRHNGNR